VSDDRAQMRARFPVPADRDLPPGRHLLHRENLMSQILKEQPGSQPAHDEAPPRRDRRMPTWRAPAWHPSARGLLVTAAAVALVAGLGVTAADRLSAHSAGPSGPSAAAAPATATAVLDRIAQAAAAGPSVNVGPNQYFYVKAQVASTTIFAKSGTVEGWIAQSQAKETLWRDNGHSTIQKAGTAFQGYGGPIIGAFFNGNEVSSDKLLFPTYAYLESLPANPRQLLSLIQQQPSAHSDIYAFLFIGQLLSTAVLPPQTAAALYRAAALIPGVTVVPDATDAIGRHGTGIALTSTGGQKGHFRLREEWIVSTSKYQFLGAGTSITEPSEANPAHEVTTTSTSAVLARGIANSPGGTPTLIR